MNLLNMENQNVEFKENWQDYYLKYMKALISHELIRNFTKNIKKIIK